MSNPKHIDEFFNRNRRVLYAFACSNCLTVYDYQKVTNFCGMCGEDLRKTLPVYERIRVEADMSNWGKVYGDMA